MTEHRADNEHGYCLYCEHDMDGGDIKQTFIEQGMSEDDAYYAAYQYGYGDGRTQWDRRIGIYSRQLDRTVAWRCPDCGGEWERK